MRKSIVIDREYGSGGREVARILSEKLGIQFYDGNMLEMAGEQCGIDLGTMKNFDEKGTGSFLHDLSLFSSALSGGMENNAPFRVHEALSRLIRGLATEQPCIFLGRCADEILKDKVPYLHVFIYATDMQDKTNRVINVDKIEKSKVASQIKRKDLQRKNYRKFFSKKSWDSMKSYDICIDTSAIGYEQAAEAIIAVLNKK